MNEPTRRAALRLAAATGAAATASTTMSVLSSSASAQGKSREVTTYVFVTGSNGMASGDAELVLRGHRTVGVSLPGHGPEEQFHAAYQAPQDLKALAALPSPMAGVTLDDYVEATVNVVRRAARYGPVILVGGSLGGSTITKAADEVPGLIDRLVYVGAYCCTKLRSPAEYLETPEGSTSLGAAILPAVVGDPAVLKAIRLNWRTNDAKFLAAAKAAFMAEGTDGEFLAMLNSSLPDESLQVSSADARGRKDAWGRVPRVYVRQTLDRVIPPALQDRMIREADEATPGNRFEVFSVKGPHAPTRKSYRRITEILAGLAR
ncbi:pimeloyl-ACP methyl ester carboxylesterase [Nonomuraea fuscirosea]|uniref:Pimeloyl-ACP methyl ester carboxylesterase n=1 Tax=Nonomuraea fuscirosea TaxID=1291556 RepID=A0A2T0ML14_9ACTN|nr:alpha/beta fold hydrolase [Nonomuraea fuscirosea]PRX58343.1 pimeloyl-ACP methyl ester carboxylesterase [Nonomuraea fuscirosea]